MQCNKLIYQSEEGRQYKKLILKINQQQQEMYCITQLGW